jgi:HEAT repeat protein
MTRSLKHFWLIGLRSWKVGAFLALLCWLGTGFAAEDDYLPQSIRQLRLALKADPKTEEDLKHRDDELKKLTSPQRLPNADLRMALALEDWKDENKGTKVRAVDNAVRDSLIQRFKEWLDRLLKLGGPNMRDRKLAAVGMIGDMGITVARPMGEKKVALAAEFAPTLIGLLKDPDPLVRQAAARALGKINPEPAPATQALGEMLARADAGDRQAAAEGLANMLQALLQLAISKGPTLELEPAEALQIGKLVTETAGRGLADRDAGVQRNCLEAIQLAAKMLGELGEVLPRDLPPSAREPTVDERRKIEQYHQDVDAALAKVSPLSQALQAQVPGVSRCLNETNPPKVRLMACQALIELGVARHRLSRKAARLLDKGDVPARDAARPAIFPSPLRGEGKGRGIVVAGLQAPDKPVDDPLTAALGKAIKPLANALKDPDARVRLAALEALITLGANAAPAIAEATAALRDENRFVRWAAVRLLGKIGAPKDPAQLARSVGELVRRLDDIDFDVSKAADATLAAYGPGALTAAKALGRQIEIGDPEMRAYLDLWPPAYGTSRWKEEQGDADAKLAAIRALQAIGTDAIAKDASASATVIPALTLMLRNSDLRVREAAAMTLGQFGPAAASATAALQQALDTEDRLMALEPERERKERNRVVHQAIADALLAVTDTETLPAPKE